MTNYIYFYLKPINTIHDFKIYEKTEEKNGMGISTDTHITEFKLIDFPTFKLKHEEVQLMMSQI